MLPGARMLFGRRGLSAKSYVQDGLIAMWDGIENAGWGRHTADKNRMFELVSHAPIGIYEQLPSVSSIAVGENALDFERTDFTTLYSKAMCAFEIPGMGDTIKSAGPMTFETVCIPDTSFRTDYATQRWGLSFQFGAEHDGVAGGDDCCLRRWWQEAGMCAGFNGRLYRVVTSSLPANNTNTMRWWQRRRSTALVASYNSSVSSARCYVDGEQLQGASFSDFWYGNEVVGDWIAFGTKLIGNPLILPSRVYAVRLYSRALAAAEIAANYAIDKARFNLP